MENLSKAMKRGWLVTLLVGVSILLASLPAQANSQSVNVAIIGGPTIWSGGVLPTSGTDVTGITFTNMAPGSVNAATLASYDTVVLNVASSQMACNMNNLPTGAKADLVAFVSAGKKLIIYDSECSTQDYSWLPFSFTTANPGAQGASGKLTIVEENTLSSNDPTNQYYINAPYLSTSTDAVGDMNVMTTFNPNWCVDMSGTNILQTTGPVHTYAKTGIDVGLYLYNGLDMDTMGAGTNSLRKIWVQELMQPFNPSNLPCGITVVGITLTPMTATNIIGTSHTVTANLKDLLGNPQPNTNVVFSIISGPNSPFNSSGVTDSNGNATFTYTGSGGVGTDEIQACFAKSGQNECSQKATKEWTLPLNSPPVATPGGPYVGDEGSAITFDGSASSDPDAGDHIVSYEWDFNNDGVIDATGAIVSNTWPDDYSGTVTLKVTDTFGVSDTKSTTVTVNNVAPKVTIKDSYYATIPVTLRIAGQGMVGNSVAIEIIQDANPLATSDNKIIRTPGSPNEQEKTITATVDLSKPYSGRLIFDTEKAFSGGTPVWVIIDGVKTKMTTFNTQKSDPASYHQTYDFALTGVTLIGKEISFTGSATDPGTDDMTFAWLFGDGGSTSQLYPWPNGHSVTETVNHTYSAAGPYTVKLDVTDDDGGVGSESKAIVIS
ncbi:MAG: PKD domain-containing protein [Candidatus Methanoperedens sp.]|nr:PKD domain-containing protein [Candidatus Methanoperedens sp.]